MSKIIKIQLEWNYIPIDSISENYFIEENGFKITFLGGKATAEIDPEITKYDKNLVIYLSNLIEVELKLFQFNEHVPYVLSQPSRIDILEGGKKNYYLYAQSISFQAKFGKATIRIFDKNGNEKIDQKIIEKEKKENAFKKQLRYHKDSTILRFLLDRFKLSIDNPQKSLFYLYDIRDALAKEFNGTKSTIQKLNILKSDWNRLGEIANDLPFLEGRHTGKKIHELKNADPKIIIEARIIARMLIEKYLDYLDKCKT